MGDRWHTPPRPAKKPKVALGAFRPQNTLAKAEAVLQPKDTNQIKEDAKIDQSSDDSFDGVRWRTSPRRIIDKTMSLSPLKQEILLKPTATVVNELTDSILSKYGLDMDASQLKTQTQKPAVRQKSDKKAPILSRLNTWIDKFEGKVETVESVPREKAVHEEPRLALPLADSDDPFSDDDSVLRSLQIDSFKKESVEAVSETAEEDPFSDDLDIQAFETKPLEVEAVESVVTEDENTPALSFSRSDFRRFVIVGIHQTHYTQKGFKRKQVVLTVKDLEESKLLVRGDSAELDFTEGDVIHLILTSPQSPKLVDNTNNLLIWHPDVLISLTVVADQFFCPRKTVLNSRISHPGEPSIPLLVGNMVHEIFQACMITERWGPGFLRELLDAEIEGRRIEIYAIGNIEDELRLAVEKHFAYISTWFETFHKKAPVAIPTNKPSQVINFSVSEVVDIEENVWSPMFGLKGMADVTLRANLSTESGAKQTLMPMEIKTGRPYPSHQAQAALYSLLFKDRYNIDIESFLLLYTLEDNPSTVKHDISIPDLRSLVSLRNRISPYMKYGNRRLPATIRLRECSRCALQHSCMVINSMVEDGTPEDLGLEEGVYEEITKHLKQSYSDFWRYWDGLISHEEAHVSRFNRDLWVKTAQEREESQGKALCGLVVQKANDTDHAAEYLYTFVRASGNAPLDVTQISKYDRVIVSDEAGHIGLAHGYVRLIKLDLIVVGVKRRLAKADSLLQDDVVFRIDKNEFFYGMGLARFNLLNLFLPEGDAKTRLLVVDMRKPVFSEKPLVEFAKSDFNEDQEAAIAKLARTRDYCLVLGMPGTGKTTLVAHMIKMLVAAGKTVLLTSYTNSAVDNILLKLKEHGVDFLRIGYSSRVHPEISAYLPGSEGREVSTFAQFQNVIGKPAVVAATTLGIRDVTFSVRNQFDYCFVDEASQVPMPLCLGPLGMCDKFVLVGDHFQLPPLVTHPDAVVRKGLAQSLFQMLAEAHPDSVAKLTQQYRMCEDIMALLNELIYDHGLLCGNAAVASQALSVSPVTLKVRPAFTDPSLHWLESVMRSDNKVLFMNHDPLNGVEKVVGENISNYTEVDLVRHTVEALCQSGVAELQIGVMTLYRLQLKLLLAAFHHRPGVELLTADRFQGRDKECIIISMVRSNRQNKVGELLKDWRRINVALTRARSKLVIFGLVSTLSGDANTKQLVDLVKRRGWVHDLPRQARAVYDMPEAEFKRAAPKGKSQVAFPRQPLIQSVLADMHLGYAKQ